MRLEHNVPSSQATTDESSEVPHRATQDFLKQNEDKHFRDPKPKELTIKTWTGITNLEYQGLPRLKITNID